MPNGATGSNFEVFLHFRDLATGKFVKATNDQIAAAKKMGMQISETGKLIGTKMRKAGTDYSEDSSKMRLHTEGFRRELGKLRNQLLLVLFAYHMVQRVVKPMIDSAIQQEFAERKLEAAFYGSGLATREQVKDLKALASQYQQTTMFGDEQIMNAQAMLATFRLNAEQVAKLTPRLLDMATAITDVTGKEVNLQSVAIALGKGVTGNTGVLSRYGVVLSETAKKTRDFNLILRDLDRNFKGIAEAMRTTFIGQVKMTSNVLSDYGEQIGFVITKSTVMLAVMDMWRESLIRLTLNLKSTREESENFLNVWLRIAAALIGISGFFRIFWRAFIEGARGIVLALGKLVELGMKIPWLKGKFAEFDATIKEFNRSLTDEFIERADDQMEAVDEMTNQFQALMDRVQLLGEVDTEVLNKMKMELDDFTDYTKKEWDAMYEATSGIAKSMSSAFSDFFFDIVTGEVKDLKDYLYDFAREIARLGAELIAKFLVYKAILPAMGLSLPVMHRGGVVGKKPLRFQRGGIVPAILETGEGVVSRTGMDVLGTRNLERLNRGEPVAGAGGDYYVIINAIDTESFRERLRRHGDIYEASTAAAVLRNDKLRKLLKELA